MSEIEPSWDLYRAFLAVMEGGSLSAAARTLDVAQPTVRRQIGDLESALGVVLFTRAPNGLLPTEAATATLPYAQTLASAARALVRSVSGGTSEVRGTVRVTCSEIVGVEVLPKLLAPLMRLYPALQVELVLTNRNEDLIRRDADIAVRMARPTQQGLLARLGGRIELAVFASAEYLQQHPAPRTLGDLKQHVIIGGDRSRLLIEGLAALGVHTTPRDYAFRTDNDVAALAAMRAGIGIGVCQVPLAQSPVPLVRLIPAWSGQLEAWLVMHEDLRRVARMRAVFAHLAVSLARYAATQDTGPPAGGRRQAPRTTAGHRKAARQKG
jgi:DNA-binding transcriptional LysR family regulator